MAIDVLAACQPDVDGVDHRWLHATVDTRWRFGLSRSVDFMSESDDHLTLAQTALVAFCLMSARPLYYRSRRALAP